MASPGGLIDSVPRDNDQTTAFGRGFTQDGIAFRHSVRGVRGQCLELPKSSAFPPPTKGVSASLIFYPAASVPTDPPPRTCAVAEYLLLSRDAIDAAAATADGGRS